MRAVTRWLWWSLLVLATLELGARIDDRVRWGAPMGASYSYSLLKTSDSVTTRGRSNYRYSKWSMNSEGFRGPELITPRDSSVKRIVVLGASETFGMFEDENSEYPARLRVLLDSAAPNQFEVVNAALTQMMYAQMLPYIQHIVKPLRPAIVVLYPTPDFYLFNEAPVDSSTLIPPSQPSGFGLPLRLTDKLRIKAKKIVPAELSLIYRTRRASRARALFKPEEHWSEVPTDRLDVYERHLESLINEIRQMHATPVLVSHVNRFLYHKTPLSADDRQHLMAAAGARPRASNEVLIGIDSAANRRLRAVASKLDVDVVEAEAVIPSDSEHFADYTHFTNLGADLMARQILTRLLNSGVVQPQRRPLKPENNVALIGDTRN
jgi:hypothetical protein